MFKILNQRLPKARTGNVHTKATKVSVGATTKSRRMKTQMLRVAQYCSMATIVRLNAGLFGDDRLTNFRINLNLLYE